MYFITVFSIAKQRSIFSSLLKRQIWSKSPTLLPSLFQQITGCKQVHTQENFFFISRGKEKDQASMKPEKCFTNFFRLRFPKARDFYIVNRIEF